MVAAEGQATRSADLHRSAAHRLALALVWATVACGGIVFSEPAPIDALSIGLMVLLPAIGLVAMPEALGGLVLLMLLAAAAAFQAAGRAVEIDLAAMHTGVTLYLYAAALLFAAFVAKRPGAHARLLLNAHLWAATAAGPAGIVAYFDVVPGAHELMTLYGRASGPFKDPNVFGPFLVPAILYALARAMEPGARSKVHLLPVPVLGLAMLLSFSRGAWTNLGIAILIFGALHLLRAPSNRARLRSLGVLLSLALTATALVSIALQFDDVADLFGVRASLSQSYDEGPEGRFGGQQKAVHLIIENPLGIGAQQFAPHYHHEEPHNVYLAMFLNAGWLGGLSFIAIVALTILHGLRHALRRTATQPLFCVAYAAFVGHAAEGVLIDLDHWRHLYLLVGIVWGIMAAERVERRSPRAPMLGVRAPRAAPTQ